MTSPAERIERALSRARDARAAGDLPAARAALDGLDTDGLDRAHPLHAILAWRRAKLALDLGDAEASLACLAPLLEDPADPFAHYPQGLNAATPLASAAWDQLGYGHPTLRSLWARCSTAWRLRGDRYQEHAVQIQLAWDQACAGDLDRLADALDTFDALLPSELADGPTRHPRAPDAAGSVPYLQLDLARTVLRAGTWARQGWLLDRAEDLLEEAAEELDLQRTRAYWFLEPIALARLRLGRSDPDGYVTAWLALAPELDHPRAGFHRALARAEASRDDRSTAASIFEDASRQARAGRYGPEWEIDPALQQALLLGVIDPVVVARIESHGVHVFDGTVAALGAPGS